MQFLKRFILGVVSYWGEKMGAQNGLLYVYLVIYVYLAPVQIWLDLEFNLKSKVQVKPNFFYKNTCMDPPKVCTKFGVYSTSIS